MTSINTHVLCNIFILIHSPPLHLHLSTSSLFSAAVVQSDLVNVAANESEYVTIIDTSQLPEFDALHTSLEVPQELLRIFSDMDGLVRVISSVLRNVEGLFPDGLLTRNK